MKYWKIIIVLVLAIFLFNITCVCASDIDTPITSENTNQMELSVNDEMSTDNLQISEENDELTLDGNDKSVSAKTSTDVLSVDENSTYSLLFNEISEVGNVKLSHKNYIYDGRNESITIIESNKVIDGNGAVIDMAGATIRAFNVNASGVTIKNLTIKNAKFAGKGGAIYFFESGTVTNCNFYNNTAEGSGGAIFSESIITMSNCNFNNNTAGRDGGAIDFENEASISNCNFNNNTARRDGGAIYLNEKSTVTNCNFTKNTAENTGGAVYFNGESDVLNCNFTDNIAEGSGGAIRMVMGNVTNCIFAHNTANYYGGAISFYSRSTVTNCTFADNTASINGGAIYFLVSRSEMINCNFIANSATGSGGAVFSEQYYNTADACIFKTSSDTKYNTVTRSPTLNVNNFTTFYGSGEKVTFDLKANNSMPITNGNINITLFDENNTEIGTYWCLSGEGWTVDLSVGSYYAIFNTEYAEFEPIKRTINITLPDTNYYITVNSITTHNKTVNITAGSNIPPKLFKDGKLLFILPDGSNITAKYADNGLWWASYNFADYEIYQINAAYTELDNVLVYKGTINITKVDSAMTLDNITLNYGESKNVTVKTEGATGITAKINDNDVAVINNYTIPISGLDAGNYTLNVTTIPDEDHNPVTAIFKITVNKVNSTLTIGDIVFDYANEGSIIVSFDGANGVIANVINQSRDIVSINGKNITVSGLDAGSYTLNVTTVPDENHISVTKTSTITVNKINSTLTIDDVELDYGEIKNVVVKTEGATGITAKINGTEVAEINNYTIMISGLDAGNYILEITTIPDANHNAVTENATITVRKTNSTINVKDIFLYYGESINITVTTEGATGIIAEIEGRNVEIHENIITVPDDLKYGQHTLTITTIPDNNHYETTVKVIIVDCRTANITVIIDGVEYIIPAVNGTAISTNMSEEIEKLKQNITNLTGQLEEAKTNATKLAQDLNTANQTINNLTNKLEEAKTNATKLAQDLAAANQTINNLTNELEETKTNATKLAQDLNTANQTINNLTNELEETKTNATKLAQDLNTANQKVTNLTNQIQTANQTINNLTNELEETKTNATKLAQDLNTANQKVTNLTNQIQTANQTINNLTNELEETKTNATKLAQDLNTANQKVTNLTNQIQTANQTINNLTNELEEAQTNATKLAQDLNTANQKVTNLTNQIQTANQTINNLTNELEEAQTNATKLAQDLNTANQTINNLTNELEEAQTNATKLAQDLNTANQTINNLTNELEEAKTNATKLAQDLNTANQTINNLTNELEEAKTNATKLAQDLAAANQTINNLTDQLQEAQANVSKLSQDLVVANQTIANLTVQLEEAVANSTNKTNSTLTVGNVVLDYGNSTDLTVTTEGTLGITAEIDGKAVSVIGYTIPISGLDAGNHTLTVTTIPDEKHTAVSQTAEIIINKLNTTISAKDSTYVINYGGKYSITVKDVNGNVLSGKNVTFTLNGENIGSVTTNTNGVATISLTSKILKAAKAGKKDFVIKFAGDSNYNGSSKTVKLTVKKEKTKIDAKNKNFKSNTKVKKLTITLKNSKGKGVKKVKVTLKIKGQKAITAKTNSKGKATFKIKTLKKKGKYTAKITYKGNNYYNKATKNVKITVKK